MNGRGENSGFGAFAAATLGGLLILPVFALGRVSVWVDWRVLLGTPLVISLGAFLAYRTDKHRAETGAGRIPESTLHLAAIAGGWPGAFLGQRIFRHKTSKFSFQMVFWTIVAAEQYLALDFLLHWKLAKAVLHFFRS